MKNYFIHETSIVDENVKIGNGTKIWHFSHIQSDSTIGENCSFGQNVNISSHVKIGNGCKIQNNVSRRHYHISVVQQKQSGPFALLSTLIVYLNI